MDPIGQSFFDSLLSYFQMQDPSEALQDEIAIASRMIQHWPDDACLEIADAASLPHMIADSSWPLVRSLYLNYDGDPGVISLVTGPAGVNLLKLVLVGRRLDSSIGEVLTSSTYLKKLRNLEIWDHIPRRHKGMEGEGGDKKGQKVVAQSSLVSQLHEYFGVELVTVLNGANGANIKKVRISPDQLPQVEDSPWLPRWSEFVVHSNRVHFNFKGLIDAPKVHPFVTGIVIDLDKPSMKPLRSIVSCKLPRLRRLRFEWESLPRNGLPALANASFLPQLEELHLSENGVRDTGLREMASWPLVSLSRLGLMKIGCTGDGVAALSQNPHIRSLRVLDLWANEIDDEGVAALINSRMVSELEYLNLEDNPLSQESISRIANSESLRNLRHLVCPLRDAASVEALSQSQYFDRLESVQIDSSNGTDLHAALWALSRARFFSNLVELSIRNIDDTGVQILFGEGRATRLRRLALSSKITDEGAEALMKSQVIRGLASLKLVNNPIGDRAANAIANAPFPRWFSELCVGNTDISEEGMKNLAGSKIARSLRWIMPSNSDEPVILSKNVSPILKAHCIALHN